MEDPLEFLLADIGRRAVTVERGRYSLRSCKQQWFEPWQMRQRREQQWRIGTLEQALTTAEEDLKEAIDAYLEVLRLHHGRKDTYEAQSHRSNTTT